MKRLLNRETGRLSAITVDHAMAPGVLAGLQDIKATIAEVTEGRPDFLTVQKGIAERLFDPYAGRVSLILKATTFPLYHMNFDTPTADVEEAVRLGCGRHLGGSPGGRRAAAGNDHPVRRRIGQARGFPHLSAGGAGVACGRFVWQHGNPGLVVKAMCALIRGKAGVGDALAMIEAGKSEGAGR